MKRLNITIIGFGRVGVALCARLLEYNRHGLDINLMDPYERVSGSVTDIAHSMVFFPNHRLFQNNDALLAKADFVFYTAGKTTRPGESRLKVAGENIALTDRIFDAVTFSGEPYIIVISNPVDVIAWHTWQHSGLPARKIISTGTMLDTVRFDYHLSEEAGYDVDRVNSWVLGEHGDSQVPVFSQTKIDGVPVREMDLPEGMLHKVRELTRTAAARIRRTQPGTVWGITACAHRIFLALTGESEVITPLGVQVDDYYRSQLNAGDIFIGLPVQIGADGVRLLDDFRLDEAEWDALRASAKIIREALGG